MKTKYIIVGAMLLQVFGNEFLYGQTSIRLVKDGTVGNSDLKEYVTPENQQIPPTPLIGLGLGEAENPNAKFHIVNNINNFNTFYIKATNSNNQNPPPIGTLELWKKKDGDNYFGIFQTENGVSAKNYLQSNLGVNVLNPIYKLEVNGLIGCRGADATGFFLDNNNQPFVFRYFSSTGGGLPDDPEGDEGVPADDNDTLAPLTLYSYGAKVQNYLECTGVTTTHGLKVKHNAHPGSVMLCNTIDGSSSWTNPDIFSITNGKVGIGTVNTLADYILAIDGNAICEEMRVKLSENWDWPDYVFSPGYNPRPLNELENYISAHQRLPDMPSAREVEQNGINLGEMNTRLVQKVEELTLYIIALDKEIKQLKSQIDANK